MVNNTGSSAKKQSFQKIFSPEALISYIKKLPPKQQSLIEVILCYDLRNLSTWAAQEKLGNWVGLSREQVNRVLKKLAKVGVIEAVYRHRHTSVYHVNKLFMNPFVQRGLLDIFPAIAKYGMMLLLLSFNVHATPLKNKRNLDIGLSSMSWQDAINKAVFAQTRGTSPKLIGVPLSHEEKCRLSAFSDEVIDFAIWKSSAVPRIKNLAAYLFKVCFDRCNELGEKPNWGIVEQLKHMSEQIDKNPVINVPVEQKKRTFARPSSVYEEDEDGACLYTDAYIQQKKEPQTVKIEHKKVSLNSIVHKPYVETPSKPERLMSRKELSQKKEELLRAGVFGKYAYDAILKKQKELYEKLSSEQQEAWKRGESW